jgi:quinol-cytochrome oxidoreductase complex cytochrome b subunit
MAVSDQPIPSGGGSLEDWVEERSRGRELFDALLHVRIPADVKTFYLGGITLFLFCVQVVTGTLLALYYQPTPENAYDSVKAITSDVTFGWLIRSVHHWAANLMILFLVLHLLRVFFQAAYKYPRELVWIIGAGLLLATIGFGFTGYLLPWDQKAFWATTVGTEIAGSIPLVGDAMLQLLRGGADVTGATLSRFFGIHVLVMPLLLGGLLVVHLTLVHQLGLADPQRPAPRRRRGRWIDPEAAAAEAAQPLMPFFPDYILDELIAWCVLLALLVCLASVFPAGLEDKANPLETPAHIKPEWYFLSLYEILKHVPRIVGVMGPAVFLAIVALLPFLDRNPEVRARRRPVAVFLGLVAVVGIVGFTIWGLNS